MKLQFAFLALAANQEWVKAQMTDDGLEGGGAMLDDDVGMMDNSTDATENETATTADFLIDCAADDWASDPCELADFLGECFEDCPGCYDCDPCRDHNYDCSACVDAGCFWCPGDALCSSQALESNFFDTFEKVSSCTSAEDWQSSTCEVVNDDNVFTDPLYDSMKWAYELVNVEAAWRMGYTGAGIHVRVNDDGVDASHPEFVEKFDLEHSCEFYLPVAEDDSHGTACASLVLADEDNDACAVGMAPGATVSACKIIGDPGNISSNEEAFGMYTQVIDISSNSWGASFCNPLDRRRQLQEGDMGCMFDPEAEGSPCEICAEDVNSYECRNATVDYCKDKYEDHPLECAEYLDLYVDCTYLPLDPATGQSFGQLAQQGRGGLGTIIVFASGNNYDFGENTNFDPLVSSRYTIGVSAVGKDGRHGSYANSGSTVLVSAPGGDGEFSSNQIVAAPGGGCRDSGEGTSFACPMVSGIVALMLEASNNTLGWRDVQAILALTAQLVDEDDGQWVENGAGLWHSDLYGYGIVDAARAVNFSIDWENLGPEQQVMVESGPLDLPIVNNESLTTTSVLTVEAADFVTESVAIYVNMIHGSRGDLQVNLISPSGTVSILSPSDRPEFTPQTGKEAWKLVTVKNWFEDPNGNWTLTITDRDSQEVDVCADLPFAVEDDEGFEVNCTIVELTAICSEGEFNETAADFFMMTEDMTSGATASCCACSGGEILDGGDRLLNWNIIVYGHELGDTSGAVSRQSPP